MMELNLSAVRLPLLVCVVALFFLIMSSFLPDMDQSPSDEDSVFPHPSGEQEFVPTISGVSYAWGYYNNRTYFLDFPAESDSTALRSLSYVIFPEPDTLIVFGTYINGTYNETQAKPLNNMFNKGGISHPLFFEGEVSVRNNNTHYYMNLTGEGILLMMTDYIENIWLGPGDKTKIEIPTAKTYWQGYVIYFDETDSDIRFMFTQGTDRTEVRLFNNELRPMIITTLDMPGQSVTAQSNCFDSALLLLIRPLSSESKTLTFELSRLPPPPTIIKTILIYLSVIVHIFSLFLAAFILFSTSKKTTATKKDSIVGLD
ncbi:MAG: hypothetical protein QW728_02845 [Thermoplasmata archaeon]